MLNIRLFLYTMIFAVLFGSLAAIIGYVILGRAAVENMQLIAIFVGAGAGVVYPILMWQISRKNPKNNSY